MERMRLEEPGAGREQESVQNASLVYEQCGCEIRCGFCRTERKAFRCFSFLNNPKGALLFLSTAAFLQGSVTNGFYNINVSTLEKRFSLRSSETGFFASAYEIAGCFALPIFSYFGGSGHKPLWIGSGVLIMGIGSLFLSLPHFLVPAYSIGDIGTYECGTTLHCEETSLRSFSGFFILGQMLMGVGSAPLYTLALSYLDENVEQVSSSTFHGIFYAASLLGPGIGYLLGGYFLTHFTTMEDPSGISSDNPLWIGNWWIGFLIVGIFFILLSVPILMFPQQMPGTESCRLDRENEIHQHEGALEVQGDRDFGKSIKDAPRGLRIILRNATVMIISLANALDSGMMIGIATFGPKYFESMFSLSASNAALYFGCLAISTASSAHLISGTIISKFNLTVASMLKMSVACAFIAFCSLFIFLITCENADIAGVFAPYANETDVSCWETKCGCTTHLYRPVCGSDNLTYLSFCDAGCQMGNFQDFENCTKIATPSATASSGVCPHEACPSFGIFIAIIAIAVFFTFMKGQTTLQSSLRAVPFNQRAFTLGVQWLIIRVVGSAPLPVIFGKVLDLSCVVWGLDCDECGSCHVYDNYSLAKSMASLNLILKGFNLILLFMVNFVYKAPPEEELASLVTDPTISLIENPSQIESIVRPII